MMWWTWKGWFWLISTLGGCVSLETTHIGYFHIWSIWWSWKDWIFFSLYFGRMWWTWKDWFWIIFTFEGVVVLKGLIFYYWLIWLLQITDCRITSCLCVCVCVEFWLTQLMQMASFVIIVSVGIFVFCVWHSISYGWCLWVHMRHIY